MATGETHPMREDHCLVCRATRSELTATGGYMFDLPVITQN